MWADKANPIPWVAVSLKRIERLRWLECPYYKECLDHAASLHWEGWSCRECEMWKERKNE